MNGRRRAAMPALVAQYDVAIGQADADLERHFGECGVCTKPVPCSSALTETLRIENMEHHRTLAVEG